MTPRVAVSLRSADQGGFRRLTAVAVYYRARRVVASNVGGISNYGK